MMKASWPFASLRHVAESCFISWKKSVVITSVMPREPPGWPDFAAVTMRTMSLRTWEAILLNSWMSAIYNEFLVSIPKDNKNNLSLHLLWT